MRVTVPVWLAWTLTALSVMVAALFTRVCLRDAPEESLERILFWTWGAPAALFLFASGITILKRLE